MCCVCLPNTRGFRGRFPWTRLFSDLLVSSVSALIMHTTRLVVSFHVDDEIVNGDERAVLSR